jgi:hypothetical protein
MSALLPVTWRLREKPLAPIAAAAVGRRARALAPRLLAREDAALARLHGVAGKDVLVVLAEAADLPWLDGIVYLGRDPEAPALLVPTILEPEVPIALVERALVRRAQTSPLAVLPDAERLEPRARTDLLVPCGGALPIVRAVLEAWARRAA